ncbi:MAG: deoxyribonuclease IV [bacterium]
MKIGAHVTILGGLTNAVIKAKEIGAECIQIFPASPQMWRIPPRTKQEIDEFNFLRKESGVNPVFIHSIYLINLASSKNTVFWGSISSLVKSMELAKEINASGVIFHIGSGKEKQFKEVSNLVVKGIKEVLKKAPKKVYLIIENSAGAGNLIGDTLEEIGQVIKLSGKDSRIKVCLDTQHIFASGYDLRNRKSVNKLFSEFKKHIGLNRLIAIHANDSKSNLGSNIDRHENIGRGKIGIVGFKAFLSHPAVKKLPIIIETPGFEKQGSDYKDIDILKKIRSEVAK